MLSPEIYLISSILRDRDFTTAVAHGLTTEMFHACEDEWAWLENYVVRYRRVPTKNAFRQHFPDFRLKSVNDTLHYVDEVRKTHARRLLTASMSECTDLVADGKIDNAVSLLQTNMIKISASMGGVQDSNLVDDWESTFEDVKARVKAFEDNGMAGIPTGFPTVDERTGGVQKGQSWIVGARLGEGKTWMLMNMAVAALMQGHRVHFSAMEMSKVEVSMRLHNMLSGSVGKQIFRQMDLAQGKDFDLDSYKRFLRNMKNDIPGQLTISDSSNIGTNEIAAQLERHRPDLYFLDYLTLGKMGGDGGWQDIGNFSKELKRLSKDYNVGMVSAAQLNRSAGVTGPNQGPAGAEGLAQSDAIGQDADAVITMKKKSTHVTEMFMAKQRHGTGGYRWFMNMDLDRGRIEEVSRNKALEIIDADKEAEEARP